LKVRSLSRRRPKRQCRPRSNATRDYRKGAIKRDLWRVTVAFNPPVNASTSAHFAAERRRVQMVIGADGRSRRLTGTETGVMALHKA
jgi:hypothetical protein